MYQPPIKRLERALKLVAIPVVLATLLVIVLYLVEAQEPQSFGVDATLKNTSETVLLRNFAHSYTTYDRTQEKADRIMQDWFSGQMPTEGQCYTLQVKEVSGGAEGTLFTRNVLMRFIEQPCYHQSTPAECGWAGSCSIVRGPKLVGCVAGWCVTREEQP